MGMYAGLRCKIKIKEEYVNALKELENLGYEWSKHSALEFKKFGEFDRATFIPCGCLSYMPYCWEKLREGATSEYDTEDVDEFKRNFDEESRIWTFQCSLKNYSDEIGYFIKNIVPLITEEILHLEEYYEEWETSVIYKMDEAKKIYRIDEGYRYIDERYGCEFIKPILVEEYNMLSREELMGLFR